MRNSRLRLLVASIPLLLPLPLSAQITTAVGVKGGVGFNDTSVELGLPSSRPSSDATSIVVGATGEFHLPDGWAVVLEGLYTRRKTDVHFDSANNLPAIDTRYSVDFLEFPVTLRYLVGNAQLQPYAFVGPNFGIRLRARSESTSGGPTLEEDAGGSFRRVNVALEGGAGLRYRLIGKGGIMADARYIYGLTDFAGGSSSTWKIREFRVLLGIVWGL